MVCPVSAQEVRITPQCQQHCTTKSKRLQTHIILFSCVHKSNGTRVHVVSYLDWLDDIEQCLTVAQARVNRGTAQAEI